MPLLLPPLLLDHASLLAPPGRAQALYAGMERVHQAWQKKRITRPLMDRMMKQCVEDTRDGWCTQLKLFNNTMYIGPFMKSGGCVARACGGRARPERRR